jgi:hypothetical protein
MKGILYPLIKKGMNFPDTKYTEPTIISTANYSALVVPKKFLNLKIFFDDYYNKIKDSVIAF